MATPDKVTILIADDDEGHTELVKRNLRRGGVTNEIASVTNGRDALDYVLRRGAFAAQDPNVALLLLLDINMPGTMNGIDVLREIKADAHARRTPVMMLTTADDPREIDRCYDLGCNVYIHKPVDAARFVDAIRSLGLLLSVVSLPSSARRP